MNADCDILEAVKQFHNFLQGHLPEGVTVQNPPKMNAADAFSVIWFLQEVSKFIPDFIEICDYCGDLFDSNREGYLDETKNYCSQDCKSHDAVSDTAEEK